MVNCNIEAGVSRDLPPDGLDAKACGHHPSAALMRGISESLQSQRSADASVQQVLLMKELCAASITLVVPTTAAIGKPFQYLWRRPPSQRHAIQQMNATGVKSHRKVISSKINTARFG